MSQPIRLEHDWYPRPLPANVTMGSRCWCHSAFAFVHHQSRRNVRIGHDTGVYIGSFFDLGPDAEVEIGNHCTLVGVIIATNGRVSIGDYTFLAHEVVLADDDVATPLHEGKVKVERSIVLGANCWIGARAVILAGSTIGEGAVVGAAAVVRGDIPAYAIAAGNPARVVGQVQRPR